MLITLNKSFLHQELTQAESALSHVLGNQTEAAYQRGVLLEKRREMMNSWANYCSEAK